MDHAKLRPYEPAQNFAIALAPPSTYSFLDGAMAVFDWRPVTDQYLAAPHSADAPCDRIRLLHYR
jgi:hypothetical protein